MVARWVVFWCLGVAAVYVVGNVIQYNRHVRWMYAVQRAERHCAQLRTRKEALTKECVQLSSLEQVTMRLGERHFQPTKRSQIITPVGSPCVINNA